MKWPKEFVAARILLCVLELIVGILLWIDPAGFATGIFVVGGVLLMLLGVVQIVQYFRLSPEEAFFRQPLVKGLLLIGIGALFVFGADWLLLTFPILTVLYGIAIGFSGLVKIQLAADLFRWKIKKWVWPALSALLSIVCGVLMLWNPFASTTVLWSLAGALLVAAAVTDAVTLLLNQKEK
jgi:uncharacterized membrane protein HdeD (DUF308 family)